MAEIILVMISVALPPVAKEYLCIQLVLLNRIYSYVQKSGHGWAPELLPKRSKAPNRCCERSPWSTGGNLDLNLAISKSEKPTKNQTHEAGPCRHKGPLQSMHRELSLCMRQAILQMKAPTTESCDLTANNQVMVD